MTESPSRPSVHLPEPSPWPATLALALTLLAAGLLLNVAFAVAGALLAVVAIAAWVAELRAEPSEGQGGSDSGE